MRSPPAIRLAPAVLVANRVFKAELEVPTFGALARERLAERRTRVETQCPTAGRFTERDCEGRAGSPSDSDRWVYRYGRVIPGRYLTGDQISMAA